MTDKALTRLEIFVDAAFAFAITMLVISVDDVPASYDELLVALKGIPAFGASFALIMSVWWAHRRWSERYGSDDAAATIASLLLMFVVLVFVYPLKIVMLAFFSYLSGDWLTAPGVTIGPVEMAHLFIIYGIGYTVTAGCLWFLYRRALARTGEAEARAQVWSWGILATTALVSALWAAALPVQFGVFAGFIYVTLCVTMPLNSWWQGRRP